MNEEMFKKLSDMLDNNLKNSNRYNSDNSSTSEFFKNIISDFSSSNNNDYNASNNNFDFSNLDIETIMKIKNIMAKFGSNQPNPRSNLLSSLRPYLNPSKKDKLDQYIKFINMASLFESFNKNFNDSGEKNDFWYI